MAEQALPDKDQVLAALDAVIDPRTGRGLQQAGLVQGLVVAQGRAGFMLEVAGEDVPLYASVRDAAEAALKSVAGVEKAQVVLTAAEPPVGVVRVRKGAKLSDEAQTQTAPHRPPSAEKPPFVKRVIAVASGKGGVGKSTVSVNLACAFAKLGLRTGLLDADVYGPSAPRMMGIDGEPSFGPEKKLIPLAAFGVKVMSMGFLVDEGQAMIWRGPMASSAVRQMIQDVAWGSEAEPLDMLVVDLPPGTGDIQLTLVQKLAVDGVVIVSTPQEISLIDARRAAAMFRKTGTPILGVVENMAWFADSSGAKIPIFGTGGARAEAAVLETPFLGEVPIEVSLRESCDAGTPQVISAPDSVSGRALIAIAEALR